MEILYNIAELLKSIVFNWLVLGQKHYPVESFFKSDGKENTVEKSCLCMQGLEEFAPQPLLLAVN